MDAPNARPLPVISDLPVSILREIGRICVAYSRIEWLLNKIVYDLLNITAAEGRLAVRDPSPDQRLDLIEELMTLKKIKPKIEKLSELKSFLKDAKSKRDAVAHGIWLQEPDDRTIYLRLVNGTWTPPGTKGKTKRRMHLEGIEFDRDEAKAYTKFVESTFFAVRVFHEALIDEMNRMVDAGELPDKRLEPSPRLNRTPNQTDGRPKPQPEGPQVG